MDGQFSHELHGITILPHLYIQTNVQGCRSFIETSLNIYQFKSIIISQPYIKAKEQNAKGSTVGHLSDKDLKGLYLIKPAISLNFNPRKVFDELLSTNNWKQTTDFITY